MPRLVLLAEMSSVSHRTQLILWVMWTMCSDSQLDIQDLLSDVWRGLVSCAAMCGNWETL